MTDQQDNTDDSETALTRREALSAGGAVAGSALVSKYFTRPAMAQTSEPRIQLGDDWDIDDVVQSDGDTDLVLRHRPSGKELTVDAVEEILNFLGTDIIDGGEVVADVNNQSVSTGSLNITKTINYWPPVRMAQVTELNTTSPARTYTDVSLSEPPSDASVALLQIAIKGDGTSNKMSTELRENGTSRTKDSKASGWAGHGAFTVQPGPLYVPMDSTNTVEYRTSNVAEIFIRTIGYY